jgi:glycosyltransferase involved in cell wall biosynthesis
LAISSLGIKHYHTLHDIQLLHPSGLMFFGQEQKIDSLFAKGYQLINRRLFNACDKVIAPSAWLLQEHLMRDFFKRSQTLILPNPLSTELTSAVRTSTRQPRQSFRFLYVGLLAPHKGVESLVNAFIKSGLKAELILIGEGSLHKEMAELAKTMDNLKVLGRLNNAEVIRYMAETDCLVVPSLCYENSPTVIYEAQAAGLPVLAASIGGIPELLNEDDRLLFKPGDLQELAQKLTWAATSPTELQTAAEEARLGQPEQALKNYLGKILAS